MIEQTASWLPDDRQNQVAVLSGLAAGDRAEATDIESATPLGEAEDFITAFGAQRIQRQHIVLTQASLPTNRRSTPFARSLRPPLSTR